MSDIVVERLGGIAGFGTARSRIRSMGTFAASDLDAKDRAWLESQFSGAKRKSPHPDEFVYRITMKSNGVDKVVEVPESDVPDAIRSCVRDQLL